MSDDGPEDGDAPGAPGDPGDAAAPDRLTLSGDELAGVLDLFGALTREELDRALVELAFKRQVEPPPDDVVERAIERYLVVEHDGRLHPGPAAFPALPEGAEDLPHILDVPERAVEREAVARTVEERFRADTARALGAGDDDRVAYLLDVSYDLDSWGPVDLDEMRERLDAAVAAAGAEGDDAEETG